ncbi:MAG: hypothetical protein O2910_03475 [Proteobacteria bacterium]|nr:hypothetical protein [Pseudomonadota bacterium]
MSIFSVSFAVAAISNGIIYEGTLYVWFGDIAGGLAYTTIYEAFYFTYEASLTLLCYLHLTSKNTTIGVSLQACLRRAGGVLVTCLRISVGTTLGYLLLVVPGIMLQVVWWVALPAFIVENRTSRSALGRSYYLAKDSFWPILALFLMIFATTWGLDEIALLMDQNDESGITYWVLATIFETATNAFQAVLAIVVFVFLVRTKEGRGVDEVAAVFD